MQNLQPTIWRTCRALANLNRLQIFSHLLKHDRCSVTDVAGTLGLSLPVASLYLRALNARGLLMAERVGRFVYYRVGANKSVHGAETLVRVLRETLGKGQSSEQIFRDLTAFTHPRRVDIVRTLRHSGYMQPAELRRLCRMSRRAARRHISKLERRGLIVRRDNRVRYRCPDTRLAKVLVDLACS